MVESIPSAIVCLVANYKGSLQPYKLELHSHELRIISPKTDNIKSKIDVLSAVVRMQPTLRITPDQQESYQMIQQS